MTTTQDPGTRGGVELTGLETIAESERKGRPSGLFWPWFAANVSVFGIAYGAYLLGFGISFWQAVIVGVIGIVVSFFLVGVVSLAGTLLLVHEASSGRISTGDLVPGLLLSGLGMGLIVAPLFDIIIAAVTERELGSASGLLNAVQQLAAAVGVAVLGTVFFDALGDGHFHRALGRTLWVDAALVAGALVLMPLMPKRAREEKEATAGEAATA